MKILALIDDIVIKTALESIINNKNFKDIDIDYVYSYNEHHIEKVNFKPIDVKKECKNIIEKYDLVFSLCSQVFPKTLVNNVRCINFHFGMLPFASGLFPITFSIINDIPIGVTIHLMDEKIDHGDIIYQEKVDTLITDKYKDIERKCQQKLVNILENNIENLIYGNYETYKQDEKKRRYFSKKDFEDIKKINIKENTEIRNLINKLKALELKDKRSEAYFVSESGEKIKILVDFEKTNK